MRGGVAVRRRMGALSQKVARGKTLSQSRLAALSGSSHSGSSSSHSASQRRGGSCSRVESSRRSVANKCRQGVQFASRGCRGRWLRKNYGQVSQARRCLLLKLIQGFAYDRRVGSSSNRTVLSTVFTERKTACVADRRRDATRRSQKSRRAKSTEILVMCADVIRSIMLVYTGFASSIFILTPGKYGVYVKVHSAVSY